MAFKQAAQTLEFYKKTLETELNGLIPNSQQENSLPEKLSKLESDSLSAQYEACISQINLLKPMLEEKQKNASELLKQQRQYANFIYLFLVAQKDPALQSSQNECLSNIIHLLNELAQKPLTMSERFQELLTLLCNAENHSAIACQQKDYPFWQKSPNMTLHHILLSITAQVTKVFGPAQALNPAQQTRFQQHGINVSPISSSPSKYSPSKAAASS